MYYKFRHEYENFELSDNSKIWLGVGIAVIVIIIIIVLVLLYLKYFKKNQVEVDKQNFGFRFY